MKFGHQIHQPASGRRDINTLILGAWGCVLASKKQRGGMVFWEWVYDGLWLSLPFMGILCGLSW